MPGVRPSPNATGSAAVNCARRCSAARRACVRMERCSSTPVWPLRGSARDMSRSPDVRGRWRLALARALLALAWGAPRLGGVLAAAGATAVSLSAGIAALAVLLLARQQLGLWSDGPRAGAPEPLRGLAVEGAPCLTVLCGGGCPRRRRAGCR